MALPSPLPDNPNRWDGWRNYNSDDPYARLCLSFTDNPSTDQIEDHCRQLLVWWQKKLPLKNQPSNPLSQMLRVALDEAPKFLAEARTHLLDPARRQHADERIRAKLKENAAAEFFKFLTFALADGVLQEADENNLYRIGTGAGLSMDEMKGMVASSLATRGAKRYVKVAEPPPAPAVMLGGESPFVAITNATAPAKLAPGAPSADPKIEFARMLRLTGLGDDDMTDDQRDALCNMGENLGLTGGQAEDIIDDYLDEVSGLPETPSFSSAGSRTAVAPAPSRPVKAPAATAQPAAKKGLPAIAGTSTSQFAAAICPLTREQEQQKFPNLQTDSGLEMRLVTSGTFMMGSTAPQAAPNEAPVSRTNVSCFYMSRFAVTNALFERFDPKHRARRMPGAGDDHPVVYVSSIEAIRFCEWLSRFERRTFRLPTEAEWEYAARGTDGRAFPWGEKLNRGDLANFADMNTPFAWRDATINDGYAETAPAGSYPRGVSPFGIEDIAGNVWEWCADFFAPYRGKEQTNPCNLSANGRRVYRGGSWKSRASSLRASARNFNVPEYSANDVGFRVVCECA